MIVVSYYHDLKCCVCCRDNDELKVIKSIQPISPLIELEDYVYGYADDFKLLGMEMNKLKPNCLLMNNCRTHATCVECLRRMALDFTNHQINESFSMMRCMDVSICENLFGIPFFFPHEQVYKVLDATEIEHYNQYAREFMYPGYKIIHCKYCDHEILISKDELKYTPPHQMNVHCSCCLNTYCYYCEGDVDNKSCMVCEGYSYSDNPETFNPYFCKSLEERKFSRDLFYKNKEITPEIAYQQIVNVILEDGVVKCPVCFMGIYKTDKCNCMDHCGVDICYACGLVGEEVDNYKLTDHWSEVGRDGCPRFDNALYWQERKCEFKCDLFCHGLETGDCKIPEHQPGIEHMKQLRIEQMIFHKIKSLSKECQEKVLIMMENENLNVYLGENPLIVFDFLQNYPDFKNYYSFHSWKYSFFFKKSLSEYKYTCLLPSQVLEDLDNEEN